MSNIESFDESSRYTQYYCDSVRTVTALRTDSVLIFVCCISFFLVQFPRTRLIMKEDACHHNRNVHNHKIYATVWHKFNPNHEFFITLLPGTQLWSEWKFEKGLSPISKFDNGTTTISFDSGTTDVIGLSRTSNYNNFVRECTYWCESCDSFHLV